MTEEQQRIKAQQVLDELLSEGTLPFKLTAREIQVDSRGEYVLRFNDDRISSCRFSWNEDKPFKEVVRAAMLKRLYRTDVVLQPV